MRLNRWSKAIYAFGNVLSIEPQEGEAWSNVANCYMQQGKNREAIAALE